VPHVLLFFRDKPNQFRSSGRSFFTVHSRLCCRRPLRGFVGSLLGSLATCNRSANGTRSRSHGESCAGRGTREAELDCESCRVSLCVLAVHVEFSGKPHSPCLSSSRTLFYASQSAHPTAATIAYAVSGRARRAGSGDAASAFTRHQTL
jgi:hypothetical protein